MKNKEEGSDNNDEEVKADDLSAYSDDSYDNAVVETPIPRIARPIEPDQPQVPIMKGQYEISNGICSWIGIWGMGIDNTILGLTSEFRYTYKGPIDADATAPLSGNYTGYFFYKTNVPRRIYEKDMTLDFTAVDGKYQMVGKGTNEFGDFTLVGLFDPSSKDLTCTKEYQASFQTKKKAKKVAAKPKPKPKPKPKTSNENEKEENTNDDLSSCMTILQHLMEHEGARPFLTPVDPVKLGIPDYFDIIKQPMDLGTIKQMMKNKEIQTREEFAEKVRLVFDNAILYNKPYDDVAVMANTLSELFEKEFAGHTSILATFPRSKQSSQKDNSTQKSIHNHKEKKYASMKIETFARMTRLLRDEECDLKSYDEFVNQYIFTQKLQRKRTREELNAQEKNVCGIVIKPEIRKSVSYQDCISIQQQIERLPKEKIREVFEPILSSSINQKKENEVVIHLHDLSFDQLQEIQLRLERIKESLFTENLQKEEVKRRKQVTEKLMQSEKRAIADLLSD